MRRDDLDLVLGKLFSEQPVVVKDLAEHWVGTGTCGSRRICLVVAWSGVVPWEVLEEPGSRCAMAVLIVNGEVVVPSQQKQRTIPLVALLDGAMEGHCATTLWQADLVIATSEVPAPLRGAADLDCVDIIEAAGSLERFINALQIDPVTSAPVARDRVLEIVPPDVEQAYDVETLLRELCDSDFVELNGARSLVCGVGRMAGRSLGVLASRPTENGGRIGVDDCYAAMRLIALAQRLRLPVLCIQDTAGVEDDEGLPKAVDELLQAWSCLQMPVITLVVGRAYGLAHVALAGASTQPAALLAWPRARISLDAPEPGDERASVMLAAKGFGVHEVIDPRLTRRAIHDWLSLWQVEAS